MELEAGTQWLFSPQDLCWLTYQQIAPPTILPSLKSFGSYTALKELNSFYGKSVTLASIPWTVYKLDALGLLSLHRGSAYVKIAMNKWNTFSSIAVLFSQFGLKSSKLLNGIWTPSEHHGMDQSHVFGSPFQGSQG